LHQLSWTKDGQVFMWQTVRRSPARHQTSVDVTTGEIESDDYIYIYITYTIKHQEIERGKKLFQSGDGNGGSFG